MYMEWNLESIIFYVLLLDATFAVVLAFFGGRVWWRTLLPQVAKHLPLTRGWTLVYLSLVLFMGYILHKHDILTTF